MKRVLAFGAFDGIHPGHIYYLTEAKKLGNKLIVVIARDERIIKIKMHEPILKEKERKYLIENLKPVDKAVLGNKKGEIFDILKELKPDVIVLGYDQKPSEETLKKELEKRNLKAEIKRIKPFNPEKFKSSKIKERIQARN